MSKTIVVVGFGPGISTAVAERFGAEGFAVALVGRSADRLAAGVAALTDKGVSAVAVTADAADPAAIRGAVCQARDALGPITALHWNAFGGHEAPDLLTADPAVTAGVFDIAITGLLSAVQEALADLKSAGDGAVLVTNGAYGENGEFMDSLAVRMNVAGLALGNAAKHKLVGLLAQRLKPEGVHVGEVMVAGAVKGTSWAGDGGIEGSRIAGLFWDLYKTRGDIRARVS